MNSPPAMVIPVDGEPFGGALKSIDADWNCEFATADGMRRVPAANLVRWGQWRDPSDGPQLILADGGRIVAAEVVSITPDKVDFDSDLFDTTRLPRSAFAGIIFHPPTDSRRGEKLAEQILCNTDESDRVLLANGDEFSGTVGGFSKGSLEFQTEAGPLKIDAGRVDALIFNPRRRVISKPRGVQVWVGFRDGSRMLASAVVSSGKKAKLSLLGGAELSAAWDTMATLTPVGGQITYLSDLTASGYRCIPYLDLNWPYHNDRSVSGNALRAGNRLHLKGLGMHSASRLTFDLPQAYRRFEAELAIDDETGRGSVIGRIFVDSGDGKWQLRYESPIVRGGGPAAPVRVELDGVKRLSLLVDFSDRGDEQDHADWLDARLVQ
jgi:NPCBM/NEW2 domain